MGTLKAGEKYAIENTTATDRVAYLFGGKMKVSMNGGFLHYVNANDFIDSPEWETIKVSRGKRSKEIGITNFTKTTTSKKTRRQRQRYLLQIAKSLSQVQRQQPVRIEPGPSRTPATRTTSSSI